MKIRCRNFHKTVWQECHLFLKLWKTKDIEKLVNYFGIKATLERIKLQQKIENFQNFTLKNRIFGWSDFFSFLKFFLLSSKFYQYFQQKFFFESKFFHFSITILSNSLEYQKKSTVPTWTSFSFLSISAETYRYEFLQYHHKDRHLIFWQWK